MGWIDRRKTIIARIVATFIGLKGKDFDKENFREQISSEYGCSMRTAAEYIRIGEANFKQMGLVDETI